MGIASRTPVTAIAVLRSAACAPDDSPFTTTFEDGAIVVEPVGAAFTPPPTWSGSNLHVHVTRRAIRRLAATRDTMERRYDQIAAAPFDVLHCVAQVGAEAWGDAGHRCDDLQMRLYVDERPVDEILAAIGTRAVDVARRGPTGVAVGASPPPHADDVDVLPRDRGPWRGTVLRVPFLFPHRVDDVRPWTCSVFCTLHVEFQCRRVGDRTYVFAFLSGIPELFDTAIEDVLDSFVVRR